MAKKSIAEKLAIKPGTTVWTSDPARLELIGPLPEGVRIVQALEDATTALFFPDDAVSLRTTLATHGKHMSHPDTAWVAYRKANRTDINRDSVWPMLGEHGMSPIGQVAIDDVWSALRFRALKPGEETLGLPSRSITVAARAEARVEG